MQCSKTRLTAVACGQVSAVAYDNPIPGFNTQNTINLRLWAAKPDREFDLEAFNTGDYVQAGLPCESTTRRGSFYRWPFRQPVFCKVPQPDAGSFENENYRWLFRRFHSRMEDRLGMTTINGCLDNLSLARFHSQMQNCLGRKPIDGFLSLSRFPQPDAGLIFRTLSIYFSSKNWTTT